MPSRVRQAGRRSRRAFGSWALVGLGTLAACWQTEARPEPLTVDRTSPALGEGAAPVLLNDSLTIYFSEDISPMSVTSDSVVLLDDDGHRVAGHLQADGNWLVFRPDPPLSPELDDGTFRPGAHYRLVVSGYPRPDAVRTRDGRWLDRPAVFDVRVAELDQAPAGLPSVLRPPPTELPFLLRSTDLPLQVAADAPRLRLHFTQPLLPTSVRAEAFAIQLLGEPPVALTPRSVRVVTSPFDDEPGSTVEIDLGALPKRGDGRRRRLQDGDWISVEVRGDRGLTDYAGQTPLPSTAQWWSVVPGRSLPLCEWPAGERAYPGKDGLLPGFEMRGLSIRPRVRVEAGNGSLGVFRPRRDVTLRPGQPFDRGDGQTVISDGSEFPFLAVDIPEGVRVTVDAQGGPVRLLACGGMRIGGDLRLIAPTASLPAGRFVTQPVRALAAAAPVALLAAGDIEVRGNIVTDTRVSESDTVLMVATCGRLALRGALPFQTVLVVEESPEGVGGGIDGPRGQSLAYPASFTYGVAAGADFAVRAVLPWRQLPPHRDRGAVRIVEPSGELTMSWQATPADAMRADRPDLTAARMGRWQTTRDGEVLGVGAGAFVRFELQAAIRSGEAMPRLRELRLVEH